MLINGFFFIQGFATGTSEPKLLGRFTRRCEWSHSDGLQLVMYWPAASSLIVIVRGDGTPCGPTFRSLPLRTTSRLLTLAEMPPAKPRARTAAFITRQIGTSGVS
jgi:hypothetical protein